MKSIAPRRSVAFFSALMLGLAGFVVAPVAPASAALVASGALVASVTGDGSVTVEWGAPSDNGSGDNYDYTVYYRAGSSGAYSTLSAATTTRVISGLTGGTSYQIRVTATPTAGPQSGSEGCSFTAANASAPCNSVADAPSTSVTAAQKPAAPSISAVSTGLANGVATGAVKVEFTAGSTNGATVSDYTATCGGVSQTGSSSPITVTGLTNGLNVTCTVTTNAAVVGSSSASAASSTATPSTTPDQMAAPTLVAGSGQLTVSWPAVLATSGAGVVSGIDDGGSAITGYEVSITNATTNVEVTTADADLNATSATISTSIVNGTAYKARVRATNANGDGTYSDYSSSETPSGSDVTSPTITVGRTGSGTVLAGGTAAITFTLSESSTDFASSDVTVSGGALSAFAGSGTSYTATFTPTASASGTASISVSAGAFTDAASNPSLVSNTLSITYDTRRPSVGSFYVLFDLTSPTNAESWYYTIEFSENVTGVTSDDFTNAGTALGCTFDPGPGSETSRSWVQVQVLNCGEGTVIPRFAANGATNAATNTGPATAATATPTIVRDTTVPGVSSFVSTQASPTSATSFTYAITFTENVTGVTSGDFTNTGTATGCTFNPGADSGATRTVTVSGCSDGTVTPRFAANGALDLAGNAGPNAVATSTTTIVRQEQGDTIRFPGTNVNISIAQRVYFNTPTTMNLADKSAIVVTVRARNGGVAANDKMIVGMTALGVGGGTMVSHGTGWITLSGSNYGDYSATFVPGFAGLDFTLIESVLITVYASNDPESESAGNRGPIVESVSLKVDGVETATNPEFASGNVGWFSNVGWQTCSADTGTKVCASKGTSDVAVPTVSSFSSDGPSRTNIEPTYTLTFSEEISGLESDDIENADTATATGCLFQPSASSGSSVTVTAFSCSNGTVRPQLKANSVSDLVGNLGPTSVATASTEITVETVPPTITAVAFTTNAGADGTYKEGDTVSITVTFSEAVVRYFFPRIPLVGLADKFATYASGSGTTSLVFSYEIQAGDNASGGLAIDANSLELDDGLITDIAGNVATLTHSAISAASAHKVDTTPPTVTVARTGSGTVAAGGTATVTFTLSESSSDFVVGDVTVSGGELSGLSGSGTSYTATFTPTASASGTASISVAAGTFTDAAGNTNTVSNTLSVDYDTQRPTVTVARTGSGTVAAGGTATITFTLSESSDDFVVGDVTVSGGELSGLSGSGTSYTATFTPTASASGTASISVAAGTFTDAAGNTNTVSNTLSVDYDTQRPTVTVARTGSGTVAAGGTATITFTLSESSDDFDIASDASWSGGTLDSFTNVSGTLYTARYTPNPSLTGSESFSVAAGTFTDAAGNTNTVSNTLSVDYDTQRPTVTVGRVGSGRLVIGGTASITFTLSESSDNFVAEDVTVSVGSLDNFTRVTGTSYTATLTPPTEMQGNAVISVAVDKFTDAAGNTNTASNSLTVGYDTLRPSMTVARTGSGTVAAGGTATVTFTINEGSMTFGVDDVTVSGGTLSGFTGSGFLYSATFTPTASASGTASISVAAGAFTDAAGNTNTVSNTLSIAYDTQRPGVLAFASTQSTPTNASTITYTLVFTRSVTGVAAADFTNTGTAGECDFDVSGSGITYTVTVSGCDDDGTVIPRFAAAGALDDVGNTGPESAVNSLSTITLDTVVPYVLSFTTSQSTPTNATSFVYSLTFSESVTGVANDDFTNSGTATECTFAVSGSTEEYSLTVSNCSGGTVRPVFDIDGARDAAGNDTVAEANASPIITRDVTAPSVSSFSSLQASPTTSESFTYSIVFSESVAGVVGGDFTNTGTASGCVFSPGADSGASRTVTVSGCGVGTVIPRFAANGASDLAGNTGPTALALATTTITREAPPATAPETPATTVAPTTTVPAPTTTTTTTIAPTTTTVPAVVVAPRFGEVVETAAPPAPAVAEGAAVAVKPGTATVLIDPPDLPKSQSITQYVVILRPVGGGAPIRRTITVTNDDLVLKPSFDGLSGDYRVSVAAVNRRGQTVGTWRPGTITVPRKRS